MNLQTLTLTITSAEPVAETARIYSGEEIFLFVMCGFLGAAILALLVQLVLQFGKNPTTVDSLAFRLKLQGIDVSDNAKYDDHVDVKMRRLEDRVRQLEAREEARK